MGFGGFVVCCSCPGQGLDALLRLQGLGHRPLHGGACPSPSFSCQAALPATAGGTSSCKLWVIGHTTVERVHHQVSLARLLFRQRQVALPAASSGSSATPWWSVSITKFVSCQAALRATAGGISGCRVWVIGHTMVERVHHQVSVSCQAALWATAGGTSSCCQTCLRGVSIS